jgi:hypothetical protein
MASRREQERMVVLSDRPTDQQAQLEPFLAQGMDVTSVAPASVSAADRSHDSTFWQAFSHAPLLPSSQVRTLSGEVFGS